MVGEGAWRVVLASGLLACAGAEPPDRGAGDDASSQGSVDDGSGGVATAGEGEGEGEGSGSGGETEGPPANDVPYHEATFAASHNSYAGTFQGGDVGSLPDQLDAGIRFVELDVHTDDYADNGYRVGHDSPGDGVALGAGNPETEELGAWLRVLAQWSDANGDHAPITLLVDLKDNPSSEHYDRGNLGALNELLLEVFGRERLFTPDDLAAAGEWPTVEEMRGRVVLVLSGDEDAQLAYVRDRGVSPAIAINGVGQVIEVHNSEADGDDLWLWTGQVREDGGIDWLRHSKYDTGEHPSVTLNDDGLVVEVHEDHDPGEDGLWYRVGRLQPDGEIAWSTGDGQQFPDGDEGRDPSIAFVDPSGTAVREVHRSQSSDQHWYWQAESIDEAAGTIAWARPEGDGTTDDDFYPRDSVTHAGTAFTVESTTSGPHDDALVVHGASTERVRWVQLAFASARGSSNDALMNDGLQFFADDASSDAGRAFVAQKRMQGFVTRLWAVNEPLRVDAGSPTVNFAASDVPFAGWYADFCEVAQCAR